MNINIRKAENRDIDDMVVLMNYLLGLDGGFNISEENQRDGIAMVLDSKNSDFFVAEIDDKIVGMCCLHRFISTVEGGYVGVVEDVVVSESCGGLGIGGLLMDYLEEYAKKAGLPRLQLLVDKENKPAISFYKKQGWEKTKYLGFRKYL